jgi:hypothetical protein
MNWIRKLFSMCTAQPAPVVRPPPPPMPEGWNLTLDDLFAEMQAGKRKSVGKPEMDWAKEYETGLLPENMHFPKKGDLYESLADQQIEYMTAWAAPYTGGGEGLLLKGERIWIHSEPVGEKPLGAYALPVEYEKVEERMVKAAERETEKYGGMYFYFKTVELEKNFRLIETGFKGQKWIRRKHGAINLWRIG